MGEEITERGLPNPFKGIGDKIDDIKDEIERRVTVRLYVQGIQSIFAALKEIDPENAPLYADLQAELAARKH